MKLPCDLGGEKLIRSLCRSWDYRQTGQVGSHVVLETESPPGPLSDADRERVVAEVTAAEAAVGDRPALSCMVVRPEPRC